MRSTLLQCLLTIGIAFNIVSCSADRQPPQLALASSAEDTSLQWGSCPPIFPEGCEIAVLHGNPAAPNADIFLRVPPNYEIPPHTHSSAERMVLVAGEMTVSYLGQAPSPLAAGDYAYGPANLPHKAVCSGDAACTLFIAFEAPVDAHSFDGPID